MSINLSFKYLCFKINRIPDIEILLSHILKLQYMNSNIGFVNELADNYAFEVKVPFFLIWTRQIFNSIKTFEQPNYIKHYGRFKCGLCHQWACILDWKTNYYSSSVSLTRE